MMKMTEKMQLVVGSILMAMVFYAVLALPGLLSDRDTVVPANQMQEARR